MQSAQRIGRLWLFWSKKAWFFSKKTTKILPLGEVRQNFYMKNITILKNSVLKQTNFLFYATTPQSRSINSFRFSFGVNHDCLLSRDFKTEIGILLDLFKYACICNFKSSYE